MDVARGAGVSKTTVSMVLAGKGKEHRIASATQELIRKVARQLNYTPGKHTLGMKIIFHWRPIGTPRLKRFRLKTEGETRIDESGIIVNDIM